MCNVAVNLGGSFAMLGTPSLPVMLHRKIDAGIQFPTKMQDVVHPVKDASVCNFLARFSWSLSWPTLPNLRWSYPAHCCNQQLHNAFLDGSLLDC